jgi:hypothetical protein
MPYVRVSLMRPRHAQEALVRSLLDYLVLFHERQPGYLHGYRIDRADRGERVGQIGVWASEADAERAALADRDQALRAELLMAVEADSLEEHSFEASAAPRM